MHYQNEAGYYLKNGHAVGSFADYVSARLEELQRPLSAPCYAAPGEQKRLDQLSKAIRVNPYQWHDTRFSKEQIASLDIRSITRSSDPLLYDCALDGCSALGVKRSAVFTFDPPAAHRYSASVFRHMDTTWILISPLLCGNNLLDDLELTFVVGHALGHCAAHHPDVIQTQNDLTSDELRGHDLTADRAALLAVLWRVHRLYPSLSADQMVEKALLHALSALHKQDVLHQSSKKQQYTDQTLQLALTQHPIQPNHADQKDEHPTVWERREALKEFVIALPFVQCVKTLWGQEHWIAQNYSGAALFQKKLDGSLA